MESVTTDRELLTVAELADRLQLAASTLTKWRRRGTIPALRLSAKVYRYDYLDVVAALRSRSAAAQPPCSNVA